MGGPQPADGPGTELLGRVDSPSVVTVGGTPVVGWSAYAGDPGSRRWSPLADLTPGNVDRLAPAWSWETGEEARTALHTGERVLPGKFEATPITLGDTLVLSTPFNRVVALDGATGRELWSFDPGATDHGLIANDHAGFVHRGVASWSDGSGRRIFHASRWWLYALDDADGSRRGPDLPTPRHGVFPVTDAGRVLVAGGGTRSGVSTSSTLEIIWPRE